MVGTRCRVMTFNVRYDTATDGANAWEHRRSMVASIVRFHAPDIVGLQEPLTHQYDHLRGRLDGYAWEGVGRDDGGTTGEYCPLGWQTARVSPDAYGTRWLSETPGTPGSSYPSASKPRLVTWARVDVDGTGLLVCNTHLDHKSERARVRSARQLRGLVAELGGWDERAGLSVPVVVLGDFNCTADSEPYRVLTGDAGVDGISGPPLTDAMDAAEQPHHGPTKTFERFDGEPDRKIDHVFCAGDVAVRQHAVIADHWDGTPPSDHCPVVAELVLSP